MLKGKVRDGTKMMIKKRLPYAVEDGNEITPGAHEFLMGFEQVAPVQHLLRRSLTTRHERTTMLDTTSTSRVTIDTDLQFTGSNGRRFTAPDLG